MIINRRAERNDTLIKGRAWWRHALAFSLFALLFCLWLTGPAAVLAQEQNTLSHLSLGNDSDYTRLVFTFQNPLNDYVIRRDDVNRLVLDFGPVQKKDIPPVPQNPTVANVNFSQDEGRLVATVELIPKRYELRHFASRDHFSVVVDIKGLENQVTAEISEKEQENLKPLEIHPLATAARTVSLLYPEPPQGAKSAQDEELLQQAFKNISEDQINAAQANLLALTEKYPQSPLIEVGQFLLAETYLLTAGEGDSQKGFELLKSAKKDFPNSPLAARASYLLAQNSMEVEQRNEAAAMFKNVALEYPASEYAPLATLKAADLLMAMGKIDEARTSLEPLLSQDKSARLGMEAYARLGMANFLEGLYSQANEIFREILDEAPLFYQSYPDILYATGEGYHYLNRPDLSRIFLTHAVNLMPDHPKADIMLARIGNAYQAVGKNREAISIYSIARKRFPDADGGVVSQMRLADMGALNSFFDKEGAFNALEYGSRNATMTMYKSIVNTGSQSPLLQLAYFKIGQAAAEDGETQEAIKWLKDLAINYPKSTLLPEGAPTLSRAIIQEAQMQSELENWKAVSDLYADSSASILEADLPTMLRLLGKAYEKQGQFEEAKKIWQDLEEHTPEKRLARSQNIVTNSLKLDQPMEAFAELKSMQNEFPQEIGWQEMQLEQVLQDLAKAKNQEAVKNLLEFKDNIINSELSQKALSKAITILINNLKSYNQAIDLMDEYAQKYPTDELSPEYILTQAKIFRRQKEYDKAWDRLADFRSKYPQDPRYAETILEQIDEANKLERPDDAFRFMELYRGSFPNETKSRNFLLERLQQEWLMGRYDDSDNSLREFIEKYPDDVRLPGLLQDQANKNWEQKRQVPYHEMLATLRRLFPDNQTATSSYIDDYHKKIQAGNYDEAFQVADDFRSKAPDAKNEQAELMLEQARDLMAIGRQDEGLALWNQFRQEFPDDPRTPDLLAIQARQELKKGQVDAALTLYQEHLTKYPDNPSNADIMLELAAVETNAGKMDTAYNTLTDFIKKYPDNPKAPQAALDQISISNMLNRPDETITLYKEFRQKFPQAPQAAQTYGAQAQLEVAAGKTAEAIATLEDAISTVPALANDTQLVGLLADQYLENGQVELWAAMMEKRLSLDPDPKADLANRFSKYNQLAQVYSELGLIIEAERNYDAALANRPPNASPETLYAIAEAYKKYGRQDKYVKTLELVRDSGDDFWKKAAEEKLTDQNKQQAPSQ